MLHVRNAGSRATQTTGKTQMKKLIFAVLLAGAGFTQAHAEARRGAILFDVEGHRVGEISRVLEDGSLKVIVADRMVTVPGASISQPADKVVTSLKRKDIMKSR